MYSFAEKPFTINGVESWIQCIDCYANESSERDKVSVDRYHYHEYIEYLYALDTDMNVWINGTPHHVLTGDLVVINSGEMHTISFNKDSHYLCVKFSPRILYFDDNSLFEFKYVTPFLSDRAHQKLFHKSDFSDVDIHALSLEIMDEWNCQRPAFELSIRANILKTFTGIFRYWESQNVFHSESVMTAPIKKALLYVSENFDTVTERDAAAACGLSYNHFSSSFKHAVGRSFNDYVTLTRLNAAEKLLLSSAKSITEIALSCGFSSTSHFISRFKAHNGITPGQLRKKTR